MTAAASMGRLDQLCPDGDEFKNLLDSAESEARTGKEQDFVADLRAKWGAYGLRMYLSEAQWHWLKRIAKA